MLKYEFTGQQVQNLRAMLMDANIKGAAASTILDLMHALDHPVNEVKDSDLHGEHNDGNRQVQDET